MPQAWYSSAGVIAVHLYYSLGQILCQYKMALKWTVFRFTPAEDIKRHADLWQLRREPGCCSISKWMVSYTILARISKAKHFHVKRRLISSSVLFLSSKGILLIPAICSSILLFYLYSNWVKFLVERKRIYPVASVPPLSLMLSPWIPFSLMLHA